MKNGKLTVAIVGMGFGSCFLPIYLKHPDVEHCHYGWIPIRTS